MSTFDFERAGAQREIDELLQGAIDMHVHASPGHIRPTRESAMEMAAGAARAGMRGLVYKDNYFPSTATAAMVNSLMATECPEFRAYGAIVLNHSVGGVSAEAVRKAIRHGAGVRVVWMPTISAANHLRYFGHPDPMIGLSPLDARGRVKDEARQVLALIAEHDLVLGTGHLSPDESLAVAEAAQWEGAEKILVTHPEMCMTRMTTEEQRQFASMGCFLEYDFLGTTGAVAIPHERPEWGIKGRKVQFELVDPAFIADSVRAVGPDQAVLATDLGHHLGTTEQEGLRLFVATMLAHGFDAKEVELMIRINPERLLNHDSENL